MPTFGVLPSLTATAAIGATAECGCHIGAWWGVIPPPRCAFHENSPWGATWTGITRPSFEPPPLSEADVERIAKRVADLIKAGS